ncbi:MAG: hypothetical protein U1F11_07175 [Steroidobacteraceae bacterium]
MRLAELSHVTERLEARAYLREQQHGFGTGQQMASEDGTRKAGIEARINSGEHWQVQAEGLVQESLGTAARRQLASAELRYHRDAASGSFGLRHVGDELPRGGRRDSNQAFATGSIDLWDRRATLRVAADAALGGRDASVDYPSRALLGVDWHLDAAVDLFAEWEHADGESVGADMTRVGVRARPWERTEILSSLSQANSEHGPRTFANVGLTQGFRLDDHWSFDLGIDQSNTLRGPGTTALLGEATPLASGSTTEDYFASFVGAQYHDEDWTLTGRAERRSADSERRTTLLAGWYREQRAGHALSLTLEARDSVTPGTNPDEQATTLRFAWAWRPLDSDWIVFSRSDFVRERRTAVGPRQRDAALGAEPACQLAVERHTASSACSSACAACSGSSTTRVTPDSPCCSPRTCGTTSRGRPSVGRRTSACTSRTSPRRAPACAAQCSASTGASRRRATSGCRSATTSPASTTATSAPRARRRAARTSRSA